MRGKRKTRILSVHLEGTIPREKIRELVRKVSKKDEKKRDVTRSILRGIEEFTDTWTKEEWVHWAYMLGHMLDRHIPFSGVDNRHRIEMAISEWVKLKEG